MVIYLDAARLEDIATFSGSVAGFTTNPALMQKAGISDYVQFSKQAIALSGGKPISFEVLADDLPEMEAQSRTIAAWGENVYVKIPACTTRGVSTSLLVKNLSLDGIKLNVTAVLSMEQINVLARSLSAPAILSVFAGRIADTGRDPMPFITKAMHVKAPQTQVLWASTREVYNVKQAQQSGADIITMTPDLIQKMREMDGMDLNQLSINTVKQFYNASKGITL